MIKNAGLVGGDTVKLVQRKNTEVLGANSFAMISPNKVSQNTI